MKRLPYWQRKNLRQGLLVAVVALAVGTVGFLYIDYIGFAVFMVLSLIGVVYLMLKALRDDLQTRAEVVIWQNNANAWHDVTFDVGGGSSSEVLFLQDVIEGRQARECYNVMKARDYIWEENIFYTEQRLKWFSIRNTAFRGVILSVAAPRAPQNARAEIQLLGGKIRLDGGLREYFTEHNAAALLQSVLKLFDAKKMQAVVADGKIYFWIETPCKLFYQFSLIAKLQPLMFISRVEQLKKIAENLADAIKI
jgi:hypothetical protein